MEAVEKNIHEFFSYLSVLSNDWAAKCSGSETLLVGLRNQSEQLQLVKRANWSEDLLGKFPDLRERLLCKIVSGLEDETSQLNDISGELFTLKKKLDSKLQSIERSAHKLNVACESSFGPIAPPIYKLMEYAEDAARYYSALHIQMTYALATLKYEDEKSVEHAVEVMRKSAIVDDSVKGSLAMWKSLQNF